MITFNSVTKTFPDGTTAVSEVSLNVPDGSFTVFVGPSGCGKTTSMRMINRMIEPTAGVLAVDGKDVMQTDPVKLRLSIGYVIQHAGLLPHRRVIDNVATVPRLLGTPRAEARRRASDAMDRVGLYPELAQRFPAQLSGGQQQRVGVARALAADPPILLMDEPFSAVDPVVREELQAEMLRLQSQMNKTIVFVTHDIDEAVQLGDQIAVFGPGGTLQQVGLPAEILRSPSNDFVADFVGRDRGYRALSFRSSKDLKTHELPRIERALLEKRDLPDLADGDWLLLVEDERPRGWIDAEGVAKLRSGAELEDSIIAGGSLFTLGGSLRQALDSALSSPSEIGVAVDDSGRAVSAIHAADVTGLLESMRQGAG